MKSQNYLVVMDIKKMLVLFLVGSTVFSSCILKALQERVVMSPFYTLYGKINATVDTYGKTEFKVGDSIRLISRLNAQDLDNWDKYSKLTMVLSNIWVFDNDESTLFTPARPFVAIKNVEDTVLSKYTGDRIRQIIKDDIKNLSVLYKASVGDYHTTNGFGIEYIKQSDGTWLLDITYYFKKAGSHYIGGYNSNGYIVYNELDHNKYEGQSDMDKIRGMRVSLYADREYGLVPVVFTNNGKNYLPIKVTE